ncbi:MAG: HlyD family type I secretion periplasmic adaptor subunit [Rickettsiales bacterium]
MKKHFPTITPGAQPFTPRVHGRTTVRGLQRATRFVDRMAARLLPFDESAIDTPDHRARPMILIGLVTMFVLFGIIGTWSALMPLATGAIAPGRVVAESNRKDIQHLEGGIVKEILVHDGDAVKEGQVLIRLDNTSAQARSQQVLSQYLGAKASEARLIAERDNKPEITFPPELLAQETTNSKVKEALDTQRRLFNARREAVTGQINVNNQKIAQTGQEIRGLREQINSASRQSELLGQEITVVDGLLKTGNAVRPRLLALQRQQADIIGQRGSAQAQVSRAEQTINESKINIINVKNDFLNKVVAELKDTQTQVATLEEQARATSDVVRRIEITAPIDGLVTGSQLHTVGGVVQPGETLLSISPTNDRLVVEAHVNPQDIDVVHTGLKAQVRLTAFKTRYLRPVEGTVTTVSADRFDDPKSQESYYTARIEIPQQELQDLGNIKLTPGMPAEALIVTGNRTMISYFIGPIRDSFGHAFHDQ